MYLQNFHNLFKTRYWHSVLQVHSRSSVAEWSDTVTRCVSMLYTQWRAPTVPRQLFNSLHSQLVIYFNLETWLCIWHDYVYSHYSVFKICMKHDLGWMRISYNMSLPTTLQTKLICLYTLDTGSTLHKSPSALYQSMK